LIEDAMNYCPQPVQPSSVAVRTATTDDLDALVPLFDAYRQFYGQPTDVGLAHRFLSERMARSESHVLLATMTGATATALGFAQLYPLYSSVQCRRSLVLNDLYVVPGYRKQGVAWALLARARHVATLLGAASMTLQTAPANTRARSLYERFGFMRDDEFQTFILALS
jgi:ribosomal protein S18 acetylase RimI-like enzyme